MSLAKRLRLECLKAGCKWGGTPSGAKMVPGRARSAYTTGQKSIGKQMDVQRNNPDYYCLKLYAEWNNIWIKMIISTFSFCRFCHGVAVGGNGLAFANTFQILPASKMPNFHLNKMCGSLIYLPAEKHHLFLQTKHNKLSGNFKRISDNFERKIRSLFGKWFSIESNQN